jgi:ABC-type Fe3+-hydroxamate transport system substrate-binding protein
MQLPTHIDNLRAFRLRLAPNSKRIRLITLLASVGLASCASTSTKTNKDVAYSAHPTRIFVIANLGEFGVGFPNEFERRFVTDVTSCGGAVEFSKVLSSEMVNPLSLGTSPDAVSASRARMEQIKSFSPDVILTMRVAHTTRTQYGQLLNVTVETYVWDTKSGKKIWAGLSAERTGGVLTPDSTRAQSLYDDLANKLRADRMIPSCAALPTSAANPHRAG